MTQTPEIIKEDSHFIVCRKPAGVPVQTQKLGQQDMASLLKNYRAGRQEPPEIYIVHRLDQPVEGIMVFAKNQKSAAALSSQIQQKSVDKYYLAVTEGILTRHQGTLEDYLLKDSRTNTSKVVSGNTKGAKLASLTYRLLAEKEGKSLLGIRLDTGRHHQIRVQMANAGFPLAGDKKYNSKCQTGYFPIGLCSVGLSFHHPVSKERQEFSILPLGEAFSMFREALTEDLWKK